VKVAVISDIHSNLHALKEVLKDVDARGIQEILCAGDLVGYGAFPNEVVEEMRTRNATCIYGNHDLAVVRINPVGMNPNAAAAVNWTSKNISAQAADYLKDLKSQAHLKIGETDVGLYHGSPRDDDEYLYEGDAVPELLEMAQCQVLVTGHTHVPYIKVTSRGMLVNPGSVGQPRDFDPRASYFIFDEKEMSFISRRLTYDVKSASQAIIEAGLPSFLGTRLAEGI